MYNQICFMMFYMEVVFQSNFACQMLQWRASPKSNKQRAEIANMLKIVASNGYLFFLLPNEIKIFFGLPEIERHRM